MEQRLLDVQQVRKSFGGFTAVDDISFGVERGEVVGIAGPNGAGKSTLFNLITGVPFGPTAGLIHFAGRRIDGMSAHRISRLGLRRTFQSEQVFETLSVVDNLEVAARYLHAGAGSGGRAVRRDAARVLDLVGLVGYRDERSADLPLFAKKQLMIASALVGEPQLLMLDEPAGGLNVEDQTRLLTLLRRLNGNGLTIIVIEHVLNVLREIAGRLLMISAGTLLVEGPPAAVLSDPRVLEAYLGEGATT